MNTLILSENDVEAISKRTAEIVLAGLSGSNANDKIVDRATACKILKCSQRTLVTLLDEFPEIRKKGHRGAYIRAKCEELYIRRKNREA